MFKDRQGLNTKEIRKNQKARNKLAEGLKDAYNFKLQSGWSPFGYTSTQDEYSELKYLPVGVVIRKQLEAKKNTMRWRTWQSYKYAVDKFNAWLSVAKIQSLTTENFKESHARQYSDYIVQTLKLSNKTFNGHLIIMKVLFTACVDRDIIVKNPFSKIKRLPVDVSKNFAFGEEQKIALKNEILKSDPPLWRFVKCIYHCFIRPQELLRLKVSDVDLRLGQIIIPSAAAKNRKQMAVEIPESFMEEVKGWGLENYPGEWFLFGRGLVPNSKNLGRNSVSARHGKIIRTLGIDKKHSMYSWKATGNMDAYLAGVDVYDIMRQNRHHSLDQTMTYLRSLGLRPNVGYSKKAPML